MGIKQTTLWFTLLIGIIGSFSIMYPMFWESSIKNEGTANVRIYRTDASFGQDSLIYSFDSLSEGQMNYYWRREPTRIEIHSSDDWVIIFPNPSPLKLTVSYLDDTQVNFTTYVDTKK